ncbi:tRNA pseudouridine(13) synthase TruD [uncultured Marinobacter sp.]|uniref:tRNA pseudouridine(13) synthase TruD n=1 Tax=uncultured Marinobacter sp. TaxID=187379 RepID=UPI0030DAFAB1
MSRWRLDWPTASGQRLGSALLKQTPEDFRVTELFDPEDAALDIVAARSAGEALMVPGSGEHLLLEIEKTGDNTAWVGTELGRLAGCGDKGVGYCGLKDRHAITRQWFSVQRPGQAAEDEAFIEQVNSRWPALRAVRQIRKLRRGEHRGNRFVITLRGITADPAITDARLQELVRNGCPNYFGAQRFGFDGGNLEQAVRQSQAGRGAGRPAKRGRRRSPHAGLWFSAARSWLFNEVLATRIQQCSWFSALEGEPEVDTATGPLWGDGGTLATGVQGELEKAVAEQQPELLAVFADTRMAPERRPLQMRPRELDWQWLEPGVLQLRFVLKPGQFATSVLAEVFETGDDSQL